jgi:nicotinamide mononucleotide transporter
MLPICAWLTAHGTSCSELAGSLILVVNVYLVTRENIWNWPVAIVGSAFYLVVFLGAGLYSDMGLQVVYIVLSVYGWYHWLHGGANRAELPVSKTRGREALLLVAAGLAGWMALFNITRHLPGNSLPLLDGLLVATSLVAQWMMTRKLLESWAVWIAVDVVYIGTFWYKHLVLTSILYVIFLLLSVLGHVEWKRSYARSQSALS